MWYADNDDDLNIKQSHCHALEPSQSAPLKVFLGYVHCRPVQHQHKSPKLCDTRNTIYKKKRNMFYRMRKTHITETSSSLPASAAPT